jgi:DNA polymerase V
VGGMTDRVVHSGKCVTSEVVSLPLYASRPAAGFPAPGDDMVEKTLDLNDLLITHKASTFFVRVEGDSMEGAGIFSGDILVVDKAVLPQSGSIVVAAVYGELVVKRYSMQSNVPQLVSENVAYAPISVAEADDVYVWGVVTGSVRQFTH